MTILLLLEHLSRRQPRSHRDAGGGGEPPRVAVCYAEKDRSIWAAAFSGGLRRGKLRGPRVEDVDLVDGVVRVRQTLDEFGAVIDPKSKAGVRKVPILGVLRPY